MIHRIYEHYKNPDEDRINKRLMNREFEKPIEEYVVDCFSSIHDVIDTIELVDSSFVIDVDKMEMSSYERTRSKRKADKKQKYVHVEQSRVGELTMKFHVSDEFEGEPIELDYTIRELIPIPDEHGKLLLKGVSYTPQYQLTETSTYVTSSNLVMKSLMPIRVKKQALEIRTDTGDLYNVHSFHAYMMDEFVNIFLYYFAKMGINDTIEYFNVGMFVSVLPTSEITEHGKLPYAIYIECNKNIVIEVNRQAFFASEYIRNIVGTIVETIQPRTSFEELEDKEAWVTKIGGTKKTAKKEAHLELGKRYQTLFTRMQDKSSKETLRTTTHNKDTIYNIIRWICQNYDELRSKDNMDILHKRLRCNQYIGFSVNLIISDHIKKFVNTTVITKEAMVTKYKNFFAFKGNEVISKIHTSGLMKYDDLVNDMNFFQKFKVTMKGPNSLGNKNSRNIAARQRALHPSHIGILGLDTCSASDPGITNYINPLCETDGLFFKGAPPEPEEAFYKLMVETGVIANDQSGECITIDPVKFNNTLELVDNISIRPVNTED
jgi:hypothetical protein